jgi:hypothetical protein
LSTIPEPVRAQVPTADKRSPTSGIAALPAGGRNDAARHSILAPSVFFGSRSPLAEPRSFGTSCGIWFVLVAIATLGRLWQPGWNITPLAGAALAAGALFPNPLVAASVPLGALAISNLALPAYGGFAMAAVVYAATAWPVVLGGLLRGGRLLPIVGGALASSLVFYIVTNFAHWCLTDDYPRTAGGLLACYWAALPFYRWMPIGDVAWSLAFFGGMTAVDRLARGLTARGTN